MNADRRPARARMIRTVSASAAALLLAACANNPAWPPWLQLGGAPQVAVDSCVAAAARSWKVPAKDIVHDAGVSQREGVYAVSVSLGAKGHHARCSVDQNGNVLGLAQR